MPTPGLVQLSDSSALTRGRQSTVTLDFAESVLMEPGINLSRVGADVAKRAAEGTANDSEHQNMRFWASGAWTLQPIQHDIANVHEDNSGAPYIIGASAWTFAQTSNGSGLQSMFQSKAHFAQSDIAGATYSGAVPATGDPFLCKRIPSAGSTTPSSAIDAGFPSVAYEYTAVPMDRVGVTTGAYRADQGFFLRWAAPGTLNTYPRYLFTFYFGQYGIVIRGDGRAELWEYCHSGSGVLRWVRRKLFRFAPEGTAPGTAHALAIYPHSGPNNQRFIAFSNLSTAVASKVNTSEHVSGSNTSPGEEVYRVDATVRGSDQDESPGHVTKSDVIRFDMRRDLKMDIQFSQLAFQAGGTLIDDDYINAGGTNTGNTNPMALTLSGRYPAGCYITATILDASNQAAPTPTVTTFFQVKFQFFGTSVDTPILWGYHVVQAEVTNAINPGSFNVNGVSYSIQGYTGDPQTERATIQANDVTSTHTRLQKRGEFAAAIQTTYTPAGGAQQVITLARGYVVQPRSERQGAQRPHGAVYPAPDWRTYDLTMVGMWRRLAERVELNYRSYAMDPTGSPDAEGNLPPYKVTDIIRLLIANCGFPSSMINIPDLPYRMWYGYGLKGEDYQIAPQAGIAELIVRLCREFIGAYLYFEPNAGAAGQWTILFGTQPSGGVFTPIYNFVTTPTTGTHLQHGGLADSTALISSKPSYNTIPPDFNAIMVMAAMPTTGAENQMAQPAFAYNYKSFKVAGSTVDPDPEHPDYIGRWRGGLFVVQNLQGRNYAETYAAVQWTCRRYYDFLCHAQRLVHFRAPLVFVNDPALAGSSSGGYRPLRFQDPISIDGDPTWLIKSINIDVHSDRMQMAEYECIQPFPGQVFYGADGHEHQRREMRRMIHRVTGHATHSALHGTSAPAPHKERAHLELPVVRQGFAGLQDSTGQFYPMAGWNAWDQSTG